MKNSHHRFHHRIFFYVSFLFISSGRFSMGVLVPADVISQQLSSAELVADIKINSLDVSSDPSVALKTLASAEIL
ncbi:hypothetical protein EBQ74_11925, partial [bacterium]|nr:hypothetical protein [bacterium]